MDGPRRRSVALAILFAFACDSSISPSAVQTAPVFGKVAVTTKAVTLVVGQEQQLSIKSSDPRVRWQSDNAASVSVSATGLVVARAPGVAHIVVRDQSAADTATVTVRASPDGIALVADSINIALGQSATLAFRALDASGAAIEGVSFSAGGRRQRHRSRRWIPSGGFQR
jgi:Bacterial Ig-like domain (group 2)